QTVHDIVQTALEQLQQRHAGDAARPLRLFEVAPELILEHPVDALHLLLLTQLQSVPRELRLPRLAVLPRWEVALLDRALLRVATHSLADHLQRLAAAQPTDGADITRHLHSPTLRRTAAVMRNRRDVTNRFHFQTHRLQRPHGRLAA